MDGLMATAKDAIKIQLIFQQTSYHYYPNYSYYIVTVQKKYRPR